MSQDSPRTPVKRRGPARWFKVTVITALVLANLAAGFMLWAVYTGRDVLNRADTDREVSGSLDEITGDTMTFLIVGSDSRAGLDDLTNFGQVSGARGDVIILVKVDRTGQAMKMLSIPRDLWVTIPGHGENRINAAYAFGGSKLMVDTIKQNLGVEINHYVEIDFVGFRGLIDELGGVTIEFPYPAKDDYSGLDVPAGRQRLDGKQALAFARSRHYEELRDGKWVPVDANDFGRTSRQQQIIKAILSEMKSPSTVTEAGSIARTFSKYVTIDSRLAGSSVARLAWDFRGILRGSIDGVTLPATGANKGGRSVVVRKEPEATQVLEEFRRSTAREGQQAEQPLKLRVLNGNGVSGSARAMGDKLAGLGFEIVDLGNAERKDYRSTTVIVPSGREADGRRVVSALGYGVVQVGEVDAGYDAVVIVGSDAS
jgi:LCP family protein required for cell wall assembly